MLLARALVLLALLPAVAWGQSDTTRDALARLEETLFVRIEEQGLSTKDMTPAIVVSVAPAFEETRAWYPAAALKALVRVFGASGLRSCEACMAPRTFVGQGRLELSSAAPAAEDITRLDENYRGAAPAAQTAIWLDETTEGVSLRIIDLRNGRILMADNFDPTMTEVARSRRSFTLARELDRRSRGDSITQAFVDVAIYPGQHMSLDWTEQWGDTNANLSGVSISLFDPVLGIGGGYYRIVPSALNMTIGAKLLMSFPTALGRAISDESPDIIDPLLTGVFLARLPIGRSNYGVILSASTNGRIGVGISLMNTSWLPFLP